MITKKDIFRVDVSEPMILGAVYYTGSSNLCDRVCNIVERLIMESAFKRVLDYHKVLYDLLWNRQC